MTNEPGIALAAPIAQQERIIFLEKQPFKKNSSSTDTQGMG